MLIVTRGPDVGARYLLDKETVTAGRSPKSDIFSGRHHGFPPPRRVRDGEGQVTLVDKGSLNGTYVNRTLVDQAAVLRPGDEVQIGKFRMLFFVSEHGLR